MKSPPPAPPLLRFGLRQMFVMVSLVTVLTAAMAATDGAWPLVIGSTAALIAAHVFGTVVGTRLRETSSDVQRWNASQGRDGARPAPSSSDAVPVPAPSSLAERHAAPRRDRRALTIGASAGFFVGLLVLVVVGGDRLGIVAVVVGSASTAVLGAWLAWVATSFTMIARHAWRHANADHARELQRKRDAVARRQASIAAAQQANK